MIRAKNRAADQTVRGPMRERRSSLMSMNMPTTASKLNTTTRDQRRMPRSVGAAALPAEEPSQDPEGRIGKDGNGGEDEPGGEKDFGDRGAPGDALEGNRAAADLNDLAFGVGSQQLHRGNGVGKVFLENVAELRAGDRNEDFIFFAELREQELLVLEVGPGYARQSFEKVNHLLARRIRLVPAGELGGVRRE